MKNEILTLLDALCEPKLNNAALEVICQAACSRLDAMLAEGITAEDCAEAYVPAAAWLMMEWLKDCLDWDGVTSVSAGDMTVQRKTGYVNGQLEKQAMKLMRPYVKDRSFVFQGVRG